MNDRFPDGSRNRGRVTMGMHLHITIVASHANVFVSYPVNTPEECAIANEANRGLSAAVRGPDDQLTDFDFVNGRVVPQHEEEPEDGHFAPCAD